MVEFPELRRIAAQKQLLQVQSEICRKAVQLEWSSLQQDTAWVSRSLDWLHRHRTSILLLAAPLGGALVARRGRAARRILLHGVAAWHLLRRANAVRSFFRRLR